MKKEFLIQLRDQIESKYHIESGICNEVHLMYWYRKISFTGKLDMKNFIKIHRPKRGKHFDPIYRNNSFYWGKCLIAPRLAWLNDLIKYYDEKAEDQNSMKYFDELNK